MVPSKPSLLLLLLLLFAAFVRWDVVSPCDGEVVDFLLVLGLILLLCTGFACESLLEELDAVLEVSTFE